ncbi:MAG: ribonuclease H-like domain-containing protein [Cellulosilyticaceae bacterium]
MHTHINRLGEAPSWLKEERAFLDIETTGLCKQTHTIYCIGLLIQENNQLILHQWMIDTPDEERLLLQTFLQALEDIKTLITYSGKQFDLPFLIARLLVHELNPLMLENKVHLDLKKLNLFSYFLKTNRIKREALEHLFGFQRTLESQGRELVKMYTLYQATHGPAHQQVLLTHNKEELMSCYTFYEIYYMFSQLSYLHLSTCTLSPEVIELIFILPTTFSNSSEVLLENFSLTWQTNRLTVRLYPQVLTLRKYLTPAKDYVYIPSQNQIMHKSVAQFIPKAFKEKVSKADCYMTQSGTYIGISDVTLLDYPIWYDDTQSPFIAYQQTLTEEDIWKLIKPKITPRI